MLTTNFTLSGFQGQSWCETITVIDSVGTLVDVSGFTVSGIIKQGYGVSGYITIMNYSIDASNTGVFVVSIPSTGTAAMPATQGVYSIKLFDNSGTYYDEVAKGYYILYPDVFSLY